MILERVPPAEWPGRLLPEWSRLLDEASEPEVFLSPEWIIAWTRHYGAGREAHLVTARDETGALVGLAPFYRRRLGPGVLSGPRVLAFLGDEGVGSEYLGILARKIAEEQFLSALAQEVKGEWALADLQGLKERPPSSDRLIEVLGAGAPDRIHRERHPCSSIALPGDYESYLTSLAAKFRTTVRYRTNKLVKNFKVRMLRTTLPEELDGHLERFFVMHQGRWEAEGHSGNFYNPRKRAFYREVAQGFLRRGWLRFYHLEVDGVIRAAQFGFAFRGVLHSLQEAFDRDFSPPGVGGVGVVLRGMAIRESIAEGLASYDFLGGVEEYKIRWGTTPHYVQRARIGARGPAGGFAYLSTARLRDARLWVRGHLPERLVEARDRWRIRRQARKARELAAASEDTAR
ncbi:MAG TPA: GNAT family N-acetyltransferase [Candidatus Dormibacteraeota bacterium]|nr:GNAT family N-acetyltransferase [Candidatus Dormibacteraeota bacterium]